MNKLTRMKQPRGRRPFQLQPAEEEVQNTQRLHSMSSKVLPSWLALILCASSPGQGTAQPEQLLAAGSTEQLP